jgi:hypothetical protein
MALVAGVMHREDGRDSGVTGIPRKLMSHVGQRQGGVPIVGVQEDRAGRHQRQRHHARQREQPESEVIVGVVAARIAVEAGSIEELVVLDEIDPSVGLAMYLSQDPNRLAPRAQGHRDRVAHRDQLARRLPGRAIEREKSCGADPGS